MSELIRTGMQAAPYIGVVTGAAIGAVTEHIVQKRIIEERTAANEIMGEISEDVVQEDSRLIHAAKKLVGPLAVAGAIVGGINGFAWQAEDKVPAPNAGVQLVVDRSGATAYGEANQSPAQTINRVVARLDEQNNFKITALVAGSEDVTATKVEEVESIDPFGDAPMRQAYDDAIDNLNLAGSPSSEDGKNPAVIVVTNGNPIGSADSVIKSANKAHTPVYVVNVAEDIRQNTEDSLQKISDKTGAQYWDMEQTDIGDIPKAISDEVSPAPEQAASGSTLPEKLFGLLAIGAFAALVKWRRNAPLTFGASNIKEGEL